MRAFIFVMSLFAVGLVVAAASIDLAPAEQLIRDGRYQQAYDLLAPLETQGKGDAPFNALLGEAALQTHQADKAVVYFQRSVKADPTSVDAHLGLGRAYLAIGDYASANIQFESVLRFDDLPPDIQQRAEIYAKAATAYARGERFLPFGYVAAGYGNYSVNDTSGTDAFGGGDTDDDFISGRIGGGANYVLSDNYALDGSLDYRYRNYEGDRRDDRDLRWNSAVSRTIVDGNIAVGVRGRASYRGNGDTRHDYGIYSTWRYNVDDDDQISTTAEFRRRKYPSGSSLSQRSRDIGELTAGWTRALLDGKLSFTLEGFGGREWETHDRPDGNSNFFGLSPSLNFTVTDTVGGYFFGWWQKDRYNIERLNIDPEGEILGIAERRDDLYEVGGGLTWEFASAWTLNPEFLWIEDDSNILAHNYSSTEMWITVRRDF